MAEAAIRAAIIEFCEKSSAYQLELDPVTTPAGVYEYEFDTPAQTSAHKVIWASYDGKDLEPLSTTLLEQRLPQWRDSGNQGTPEYVVKHSASTFRIAPVPNTTVSNSTILRVALKPTQTSSACDVSVIDNYRDTIINGAIFRLLRMPNQAWTDYKGANIYGGLFASGIRDAELKARHADEGVARKVKYGGLSTKTRHGKRGWRSAY